MGLVHSDTISDGLSDLPDSILDGLRHGHVPEWMRARAKVMGRTSGLVGVQYLNSQRDLAKASDNGAIARFYVFSPMYDSWHVPDSVAERVEAYLKGDKHAERVEALDEGQFFKGVFVVADLDSTGEVTDVSLEAVYWD
jgi:hypothetical protein